MLKGGGFKSQGKLTIEVPTDKPCYISLLNLRKNNIDFKFSGENVQVFKMALTFPFNVTT